jgi:hypothetical protein
LLLHVCAQEISHVDAGYSLRPVQCPEPISLAGFQLITYGRFWVFTEVPEE